MPTRFDLPTLSSKDYAQLQQELTAAIPKYSDGWTDFNYSDPGITLVQLLSWLGDMMLYRIDLLPVALYVNFLRLVVGSAGGGVDALMTALENDVACGANGRPIFVNDTAVTLDPHRLALARYLAGIEQGAAVDLVELRARVTAYLAAPYRAITEADFALLAAEVTALVPPGDDPPIGRVVTRVAPPYVRVLPVLAYDSIYFIDTDAPTTLIAKLAPKNNRVLDQAYDRITSAVAAYLAPRRTLGTPVSVEEPVFTPLIITATLYTLPGVVMTRTLQNAFAAIPARLSPITGGDGGGWPYDMPVTAYDIVAILQQIDGVDTTRPIEATVTPRQGLIVGSALMGDTTYLGAIEQVGLPLPWNVTLQVPAT